MSAFSETYHSFADVVHNAGQVRVGADLRHYGGRIFGAEVHRLLEQAVQRVVVGVDLVALVFITVQRRPGHHGSRRGQRIRSRRIHQR